MKRIAKLLCLIALVALVGTSCKKQEGKLTFTASMGNGEWKTEDKLYLADNNRMWFEEGDQVMLCNVDYDTPSNSTSGRFQAKYTGESTEFEIVGPATLENGKLDAFFAYYPGEEGMCSFDWEGTSGESYHPETYHNYGCFRLAPVQNYRTVANGAAVPKKALFAAAKDETISNWQDANFAFTPISGLLRFKFYGGTSAKPIYVKSVKVTDPDRNLVGNVYLCIDKVNPLEMEQMLLNYNPDDEIYLQRLAAYCQRIGYRVPGHAEHPENDTIDANPELSHVLTLNCVGTNEDGQSYPNGVEIGTTKAAATAFMLGVRPAAFYHGFTLDVVYEQDGEEHAYQLVTNKNLMIKPATIMKVSSIQLEANND